MIRQIADVGRFFTALVATIGSLGLYTAGVAQTIIVGAATGQQGSIVDLPVALDASGTSVARLDFVIGFDRATPIGAASGNRPDCTVNPAINKPDTRFRFRPAGCRGASCTGMRAIVYSRSNTTPIPDGATLYSCRVDIAADAAIGNHPLLVTRVKGKGTDRRRLRGASGTPGDIFVVPSLVIGSASGPGGTQRTFTAVLSRAGSTVLGIQHNLSFDRVNTPIAATPSGAPDCTVNPGIDKPDAVFSFLPPGCSGSACTGMRALVLSVTNTDPIPTESVLYSCRINIAASAPVGTYLLNVSGLVAVAPCTGPGGPFLSLPGVAVNGGISVTPPGG
jgi:hypothetical protein